MGAIVRFRDYRSADFCSSANASDGTWPCIPDAAALSDTLDAVRKFRDLVASLEKTLPPGLGRVELEHASKFCVEVGANVGWDVNINGIGGQPPPKADLSEAFAATANMLRDASARHGDPRALAMPSTYPIDTNCGLPFVTNDPLAKLLSACVAVRCGSVRAVNDTLAGMAAELGSDAVAAVMLFTRTRSTNKELDEYELLTDGVRKMGTVQGLCAGRRGVYGVPSADNMVLQPGANGLKAVLLAEPEFGHSGPDDTIVKLQWTIARVAAANGISEDDVVVIEVDYSGYDLSVGPYHHGLLRDEVYTPIMGEAFANDWFEINTMPLAAPPVRAGQEACLYERPTGGLITSGEITTTLDGSLINVSCIYHVVGGLHGGSAALGRKLHKEARFGMLVFGDDTLLVLPRKIADMSRMSELYTECGLKAKIAEGSTFLMKYLDVKRGTWYPLASRVIQRTLGGERPVRSDVINLLGLAARTEGLSRNPLHDWCWATLRTVDGTFLKGRWNLRYHEDAARTLARPDVKEELELALKSRRPIARELLASRAGGTDYAAQIVKALIGGEGWLAGNFDWKKAASNAGFAIEREIMAMLKEDDKKARKRMRKQLLDKFNPMEET